MVRATGGLCKPGRKAQQTARRRSIANEVAQKIFPLLDMETLEETGTLYPRRCDMRKKKNRRIYSFLKDYGGRVFTSRLNLLVTKKLVKMLPFELARNPRESQRDLLLKQAKRLGDLARRSKRTRMVKEDIDNVDTVPMFMEACCGTSRVPFSCPKRIKPRCKLRAQEEEFPQPDQDDDWAQYPDQAAQTGF